MTIKVRKKKRTWSSFTNEEKWLAVQTYTEPKDSHNKYLKSINSSVSSIKLEISKLIKELNNKQETNLLIANTALANSPHALTYKPPSFINSTFMDLLSGDHEELTEHEYHFAYIFVNTLDAVYAIRESKLDAGLKLKNKRDGAEVQYLQLRAKFLQAKPNIKEYISLLRKDKLDEVTANLSPSRLQAEIMEQYEAAKLRGDHRAALALLRQLGESVALFKSKVEVEEINPGKVLDELLEMNKAEVRVIDA